MSVRKSIVIMPMGAQKFYNVNPVEEFCEANGILRPYINVDIPVNAIKEITVGPLLESDIAKQMVIDIIGKYFGINNDCNISLSGAPIRF